jgi:CMP-N-acetylneuraminic acid synthetase
MDNTLILITARSGSKGIPNKNIKLLGGLTLLEYKIKTALSLTEAQNIWLNTDSELYAEIGKRHKITIPFLRPKALADDSASSIDVILHTIKFFEEEKLNFKYICLFEPTSPFVYYNDVKMAYNYLLKTKEAKAIVATKIVRPNTMFVQDNAKFLKKVSLNIKKIQSLNRQNFKEQITPSGGFYISEINHFKKYKTFYTNKTLTYNLPSGCDLEIDEPIDFKLAEFYLENKLINISKIFK